jgi:hypothetical protein
MFRNNICLSISQIPTNMNRIQFKGKACLISYFVITLSLLNISSLKAQSDRKVVEYPALQNMLKGVWATTPNGGSWIKIEINNNQYSWYSAFPQDGKWVDMSNHHKMRTIKSFLKITERNAYDGKPVTYYVGLTDEDENGFYRIFRIDIEGGKEIMTVIAKGDKPNYSLRSGADLNAPIIIEGFRKRQPNFNPWQ